jgi:hypothetical protein
MHRFSSQTSVRRLRVAAILLVLGVALLPVAIGWMVRGAFRQSPGEVAVGFGLAVTGVMLLLLQILVAQRVRCPLCMTPPLGSKSCQKNRKARPLMGSYRLRVACAVLTKDHFRCPYCGEPTLLEARVRQASNGNTTGLPRRS